MSRSFHAGLLAALLGSAATAADPAAALTVVTSIKPVHSLAAQVMGDAGAPVLLMQGAASPHTYAMKPSDARSLENADVIFWIGPGLETMLKGPIAALPKRATVVALAAAPGMTLLPYREGGAWAPHDDDHGHEHSGASAAHDHEHQHGHEEEHDGLSAADLGADMHVWLDPRNASAMVDAIERALAAAEPSRAADFAANAARAKAGLAALDRQMASATEPLRDRRFVVFHDAYQYFEARYDLAAVGSVTVGPDRQPGARRVAEIRSRINELGAVCVFTEPQFPPAIVETAVQGTKARIGTLDPIGADIPPGPGAYRTLLERLAGGFATCLDPTG